MQGARGGAAASRHILHIEKGAGGLPPCTYGSRAPGPVFKLTLVNSPRHIACARLAGVELIKPIQARSQPSRCVCVGGGGSELGWVEHRRGYRIS